MSRVISLRELQVEQPATIATVKAGGEMGRRIRDMGLAPGVRISVVGRAPLKDPVALRVLGAIISLRNNEADFISVQVEE